MSPQASVTMLSKNGSTVIVVRHKNHAARCVRGPEPVPWVLQSLPTKRRARAWVKDYRETLVNQGWLCAEYKSPLTKDEVTLIHAGITPATFDTIYAP